MLRMGKKFSKKYNFNVFKLNKVSAPKFKLISDIFIDFTVLTGCSQNLALVFQSIGIFRVGKDRTAPQAISQPRPSHSNHPSL